MNIIMVDDEKYLLEELNDAVSYVMPESNRFCFSKASEAIEFAKKRHVDVAFLDINMRVIDGISIAKQLQDIYPKVNIIFCTGYTEFALDALNLNCSGYILKPVTVDKVRSSFEHLRFPVEGEDKPEISFRCFGNFDAFCNGTPIKFKYNKTKELLAYLVDRNGTSCTTREISAVLFEDEEHNSYFSQLRHDLVNTFEAIGASDIIRHSKGILSVDRDKVKCDYFDYMDDKIEANFSEYMTQYSFGEGRLAAIEIDNDPDYWD